MIVKVLEQISSIQNEKCFKILKYEIQKAHFIVYELTIGLYKVREISKLVNAVTCLWLVSKINIY